MEGRLGIGDRAGLHCLPRTLTMYRALILSQQVPKALWVISYTWRFEQPSKGPLPPVRLQLSLAPAGWALLFP